MEGIIMRRAFVFVVVVFVVFIASRVAYHIGYNDAILSAAPSIDGKSILIDFDGAVHVYDVG